MNIQFMRIQYVISICIQICGGCVCVYVCVRRHGGIVRVQMLLTGIPYLLHVVFVGECWRVAATIETSGFCR